MQATNRTFSFRIGARIIALSIAAGGLVLTAGSAANAQIYIGNAYDAGANTGLGLSVLNIVNLNIDATAGVGYTGALPTSGGNLSTQLLGAGAKLSTALSSPIVAVSGNANASTQVATASTVGANNKVTSDAKIANVSVLSGLLTADAVESNTTATYSSSTSGGAGGTTTITGLKFGGNTVTVTGAPNQIVDIFGGIGGNVLQAELIINEQIFSPDHSSLTTNALDVQVYNNLLTVAGVQGKVVVASSTAGFSGVGLSSAPEPGAVALLFSAVPSVAGMVAMRRRRAGSNK